MTDHCLDTDWLVSVGTALEWDVPARLDHLAVCERCRAGLVELADLHGELAAAPPLPHLEPATATAHVKAGLATGMSPVGLDPAATTAPSMAGPASGTAHTGVMAQAPAAAGAAGPRRADRLVTAATFLVAGATTFMLVLLLGGSRAAPWGLVAGAAAGLASALPVRLPFRAQEA